LGPSRRGISRVRCSALPSCGMWSPAVLPSGRSNRASSTSKTYIPFVRCGAMLSCWMWSRPYISYERCRAMPSRRVWPTTVLPAACAVVLAAPSGLASLTSDAAPCHRAGCACLPCGLQRVGKRASSTSHSWYLLRARLRLALVSGVAARGAAISGCESASSTCRHCIAYERGGARPARRMWATVASRRMCPRTVLPAAHARRGQTGQRGLQPL